MLTGMVCLYPWVCCEFFLTSHDGSATYLRRYFSALFTNKGFLRTSISKQTEVDTYVFCYAANPVNHTVKKSLFRESRGGCRTGMREKLHIGKLIQAKVEEENLSIVRFAQLLNCSRTNVYKIFERPSIDTNLLERISRILEYDFFHDISQNLGNTTTSVPK